MKKDFELSVKETQNLRLAAYVANMITDDDIEYRVETIGWPENETTIYKLTDSAREPIAESLFEQIISAKKPETVVRLAKGMVEGKEEDKKGMTVGERVKEIVDDYTRNHKGSHATYEVWDGYEIDISASIESVCHYVPALFYKGKMVSGYIYDVTIEELEECVGWLMDEIDFG